MLQLRSLPRAIAALGLALAAGCGGSAEKGQAVATAEGKAESPTSGTEPKGALQCGERYSDRFDSRDAGPHRYTFAGVSGERLTLRLAYHQPSKLSVTAVTIEVWGPDDQLLGSSGTTWSLEASLEVELRQTGIHQVRVSPGWGRGDAGYGLSAGCGGSRPLMVHTDRSTVELGQRVTATVRNQAEEPLSVDGCFFRWERMQADRSWQPVGRDEQCNAPAVQMLAGAAQTQILSTTQTGVYRLKVSFGVGCEVGRSLFSHRSCDGRRASYSPQLLVMPSFCQVSGCSCHAVGQGGTRDPAQHACDGLWTMCYDPSRLQCGQFGPLGISCGWRYPVDDKAEVKAWYANCMTSLAQGVHQPPPVAGF